MPCGLVVIFPLHFFLHSRSEYTIGLTVGQCTVALASLGAINVIKGGGAKVDFGGEGQCTKRCALHSYARGVCGHAPPEILRSLLVDFHYLLCRVVNLHLLHSCMHTKETWQPSFRGGGGGEILARGKECPPPPLK